VVVGGMPMCLYCPHLVHQCCRVHAQAVEDGEGGGAACGGRRLGRDRERVDECLRMLLAHVRQQLADKAANRRRRRMNPRNQLCAHT
jgi:hypothetical protein